MKFEDQYLLGMIQMKNEDTGDQKIKSIETWSIIYIVDTSFSCS